MTDYFVKVTKWLGYFLALLVIIAATLVSVGRLFTPYLNQHKTDFETWASQLLNVPVEIGQVRISWNAYVPELTLNKVTILDKITNKPTFDIKQVKINVKIIESLIKREPIPSYIKISGMDLTIHSKKTAWNVVGFGDIAVADNLFGGMHEVNEMVAWIFSQPALVLNEIYVTFYTQAGIKKSITLDELSLLNANTKHLLSGKGTLNQDIPTHVELALDWRGDDFDLEKLSANLYLYVEGISLPQWFKQQSFKNMQIKEGLGSAKIWLAWDKGQLQKIQTQLQLYHVNIYSLTTQQTQSIARLSGHFGWKREGKNQVFAGNDILIDLPHHLWPTTSFTLTLPLPIAEAPSLDKSVNVAKHNIALELPSKFDSLGLTNHVSGISIDTKTKQERYVLSVSYVDLSDMTLFAYMTGLMPEDLKNKIKTLQPKGEITSFMLDIQDGLSIEHINKIMGKFNKLSWNLWDKYPGIKELSGALAWDGKNGSLDVDSENIRLIYPSAFEAPVPLGKLTGQVQFKKDKKDTWLFNSKKLSLSNDNLEIDMNAIAEIPKGESPKIDLISNLEVKKANRLARYFPLKIMEPDLSSWLVQAFHGGKFVAGNLIIQGRLSDFPFTNHDGIFSLTAEGKDLDFGYALGWPSMKKVYGNIQFIGRKMVADIKSGLLQGMPVSNVHVDIPYIGKEEKQLLLFNGMIEGNIAQGMQLFQHSPLKNKVRKELSALQITGPMSITLNVNLPLKNPEQAIVVGDMKLVQVGLSVPVWNMSVDNINGIFHFTEKSIEATDVTGRLWGEPMALQVHTEHSEKQGSFINLQMSGHLSSSVIHSFVQNGPYAKFIQGGTAYQATLRLGQSQLSEPVQLIIDSNLKGITLDLPMGLGKKADELIPSTIIATDKQNKPLEIMLVYGDKLTAAATIKNTPKGMQFYSAELRLGNKGQAAFQAEPGVLISGQFDTLDWNVWKPYFDDTSPNKSNVSYKDMTDLFRGFDIHVNKIIGFFQPINKAHLELMKSQTNYTLTVDSTEIAGVITLPIKSKQSPIQAKFDHLYLVPLSPQHDLLEPSSLPAVSFVGDDVRYQDKHFGHVSFDILPIKDGVAIQSLRVDSDLFNLSAKGEWTMQNKKAETVIEGKLTTNNVAKFLSHWGSPTVNPEDSEGTVLFDLSWPDAPYSPVLSGLEGKVDLALSAGRIVNLDQATNAKMGIGRFLNLLSLDSISRALTFNFKDLTEKGYSFDSVKGQFTLKDGSANTDNVRMEGSIARIEMSGRLGLAAKDYDIKISVTPFVTGSIPVVAAAIAVNPIVGIAAWAVEKIAGQAVSSVTTHHYEVKGTWDKPVWVDK